MAKGQYTAADLASAPQQQNSQAGQYSAADLAPAASGAAAPSFRQKVDSALNNTESNGPVMRAAKGVGRVAAGLIETPYDLLKPPQDDTERTVSDTASGLGANPGTGMLAVAMKRALQGNYEYGTRAVNAAKEGDYYEAGRSGLAAAIPLAGPWAAGVGQRMNRGDIAGGIAEATTGLIAPKIGGKIAGKIASGIERSSAPLADTMTKPRGITPAEAATPAELQAYAQQHNLPVNAAQVTEHSLPRSLQTAGERSTVGGTAVRQQINNAGSAISQHASNLMDQMAPGISDVTEAGNALRGGIEQALDREKQVATQNYANIDRQAKNVQVDLRPIKQLSNKLLSDNQFIRENAKTLDPKRGSAVLNDMTKLPDQGTFTQAQQLRSRLLDEARHPENAISQDAQGWIKLLTKETDDQMMTAAQRSNSPAVEQQFRDANAHWKGLEENFNNQRSPMFQAMQEYDPAKIAQKFSARGQIGGSPNPIKTLQQYGIDTAPLKRAVAQDIAGKDFRMQGHTLAGYSDDFLRTLFSPDELDHVYKTSALARSVGRNVNPSGTAGATQAEAELHHPIRGTLNAGYADLTNRPSFNQRMTRTQPTVAAGQLATAVRRGAKPGMVAGAMRQRDQR